MKPKNMTWLLVLGFLAIATAIDVTCDADIEATHCPRTNFVSCLREQRAALSASCTSYMDDLTTCYEEVNSRCGDAPDFLCLATNAASLSETCLGSAFADDVRRFLGEWKAAAWAVVEDGAADVRAVNPCLADFETLHCQYTHPAEALSCIAAEVQRVSDRCRAYVDGYERCFQDVASACSGERPQLECLWRQMTSLSPECKASPFFRHAEEGFSQAVQRVTGVSIPACAIDIVSLPCKLTDALTCLIAHRDQLTDSCSSFVGSLEGCYASVQAACGTAHCKFMCLVRHRSELSEDCRRSPFFRSALDAVGEVRADMTKALVAVESRAVDVLPMPCLQDFEGSQCDSREPREAFRCLQAERRQLTAECEAYVAGMATCAASVGTVCQDAASLVDCLWDRQETLSPECKSSAFYTYVAEKAAALQQQISTLTVPECMEDLVQLDCSPSDFVTCLADNRATLSSPCAAYLSSMENCYDSVQRACEGAKCQFMCLVDNRQSVSEACSSSAFFQRVLAAAAAVPNKALATAQSALQSIADRIQELNPCHAELEVTTCDTRDPHAAFNCLQAQTTALSTQCRAYIEGLDACMTAVEAQCSAADDPLNCLWEHRADLNDACRASSYFDALQSHFVAQLPLKPCVADAVRLSCVSHPLSFLPVYECLHQQASAVSDACREVLDGVSTCVSSVGAACPLDNDFVPCVVERRKTLSPACHASSFFGAIVPAGAQSFGECLRDIISLGCLTDNVVSTLECLASSSSKLTPSCGRQFTGAVDCLAAVLELCPQPNLQCILAHEAELQQKCLNPNALNRVRDLLSGSQVQLVGEVMQCAHDFSKLGCQFSDTLSAGASCALGTLQDVPAHCHRFLGGLAGCVAEYRSFCDSPLSQLQWVLEHREEMGEECRKSNFLKTFDMKSSRPLVACSFDLVKLRCMSTDLLTSLRCLSNNQGRLGRSCSAALSGFGECMHNVEERCSEGFSLSQLLWIYEHQEEFSSQCQASPFFRATNRLIDTASSGLASTGLLECSTDILQNGCLAQGPGAQAILGCLQTAAVNPLRLASEQCRGLLVDMYHCQAAMPLIAHAENPVLVLWANRNNLPADCNNFFTDVQARMTKPMYGTADLPQMLQDVAALTKSLEWPCSLDQQLLGCDKSASVDKQLQCLLDSATQLSSQCQEFFVGRDQCLADVADACRIRTDLPSSEAVLEQQSCIWTHASHLSPACIRSLFVRYFLFPLPDDSTISAVTTLDEESNQPDANPSTNDSGASTEPANPEPATFPDDILAFYQAGEQTGYVGFADICQADREHWCADVATQGNPHRIELRECLESHQSDLTEPCGMWSAGREVCFADVQHLCGSLETPFRCMSTSPGGLSQACRGSVFFQSMVAWAKTYHLRMGSAPAEEGEEEQQTDASGNHWTAILVPIAITFGVLAFLGSAYFVHRRFVRRQRAGPEQDSAFKQMEETPDKKGPNYLGGKKTSPDLIFHAMEKSPDLSEVPSSDTSSPELKVFLGDMTPSNV
eukprot:GGOE01008086.1.p1 GENE.GGOE01008086.1~~GGOE01008086.1.p1  ORF type:complete len:1518 (+),score=433.29 GGOE01008086.1:24-4556(+)